MPASYVDSLALIADGENVNASVANRPIQQLKNNTDYLKNLISGLAANEGIVVLNATMQSSCIVGTPVFYNVNTARYEPAQAAAGAVSICIGVVLSKTTSTLGTILLGGYAQIDITNVLAPSITLVAGRYYLHTTAGKITTTVPSSPTPQISVLVADAAGNVYVFPYQLLQGDTGTTGATGSTGATGAAGASSREVNFWRTTTAAGPSRVHAAGMLTADVLTTATFTASTGVAMPFISPRGGTIDQLSVNVTIAGATGALARLGIYSATSATNIYPNAVVVDVGTIAVDVTGVINKSIGGNFTPSATQLYWIVVVFDTTSNKVPTMVSVPLAAQWPVWGLDPATLTGNPSGALIASSGFSAPSSSLPGTFPGSASTTAAIVPLVACRYSA